MRLRTIALNFALLMTSVSAQASTQSYGYITGFITTGNRYLIYMNGSRTARPACDCCARWEIDGSTAMGQTNVSLLLTAYALHHTVQIVGTGACVSGSNDTEGVSLISTDNL